MSIPDPPWKKRTRPCPFYSQGRCVFSESCGFLHDVKIKSSVSQDSELSSSLGAESSRDSMGSIVKSPPAVARHLSASSSSSARTPRMTSLLSALQGIIGPISPVKAEFPAHEGDIPSSDTSDASPRPHGAMRSTGPVPDGNLDNEPVQASQEDTANATATSLAVDNDMSEDPSSNPMSPPGLLSPVRIGPDSPFQLPHVALDGTLSREDSIDSGYAETWVGPTPFSLSPPQLNQPGSTLDLLSFPFGSPLSRVLPRRYSHSMHRSSSSAPRDDSIDLVSPPVPTTAHQDTISARTSLESITMMYATESTQSSPQSTSSNQGETEDANRVFGEPDPPMALSIASLAETLLFPVPPSRIPVLKHSAPLTSENVVDPQLAADNILHKDSSSNQEEGASPAVVGMVATSPTPEQFSTQPCHATDTSPSSLTTMDTKMSSPYATGPLSSPISLKPTEDIGEPDYDALYQSMVMSPEEAAAKRMSWASRPSPSTPSTRAASASCSTSALVDIPERPHSAVDVLPWSRQWDLQVTTVSASENNSRTSSPLLRTLLSSSSSEVYPSVPSVYSVPNSAPPGKVTSTLNDRSEVEPTRSKWSRVSTSRRVPFGFRHSSVVNRGHTPAVAPRTRRHPSALNSPPPFPFVDRFETPLSASSFSSEPSRSKPSWARPLHLSRPSQTGLTIHPTSLDESLTSANVLSGQSHSRHHSVASSRPHSPRLSHDFPYSEHHVSNSPTQDTLQLARLHHIEKRHYSSHTNSQSDLHYRQSTNHPPEGTDIDDNTPENGDHLRTLTRGPAPLPTSSPAPQHMSSLLSLTPASTVMQEHSLMFAIASDDAKSVHHVLEHGHADPNESMGPQSALAFALTNERLAHKLDIVKALLAYGADPMALRNPILNPPLRNTSASDDLMLLSPPPTTTLEVMDPAMRYYVSRAEAPQTHRLSGLLQQSSFRPLARVRYEIVGQDHVFEQLFTILNQHSKTHSTAPLVILLCGPSGHGKSFLARRVGSLLNVPTHTVNVTTLRSTHDLWDSCSMGPYEELSTNTLSQFLIENEGKRCVVVLDEIEKVEEPKILYSLLMPWELGRCSLPAEPRQIDVRQVIWLGTSNIGHDLVFECYGPSPGKNITREEYLELAQLLRPGISHSLGASLTSRVTTILPFVPFTEAELIAIATEVFYSLGGEQTYIVPPNIVERISRKAIECYIPEEGARSLHRAISSLLMDIPDLSEQNNT